MNQDAFRNLLKTESSALGPSPSSRSVLKRGSKPGPSNAKAISTPEPAFKPRKIKKASETYRNRAEERRSGKEGDYAQVEAILEEFEKRNADNEDRAAVEEQRRYLGGDSEHSILVKGLDLALLQQNKARLASTSSKQDDEALEEVFAQAASTSSAPASKKRSRADIIKELKEQRANGAALEQSTEEPAAEQVANSSKFRPIGFKRIGPSNEEKVKKKKGKEGGEQKKKKRKVEPSAVDGGEQASPPKNTTTAPPSLVEHQASTSTLSQPIQQETEEDGFDIFADAAEYKGMEFGSDDDSDEGSEKGHERSSDSKPSVPPAEDVSASSHRGWFDDAAEPGPEASPPTPAPQTAADQPTPVPEAGVEAEEEEQAQLAPLTSSAIPSIRDFLAMDAAIEETEKRKARKEKRKGKNKGS